ncbi:MAG: hypothetical protein HYX35_06170 [Proteobacteria bacterium]|nr:hypothetical protein [Pseudomonadota bacterium]
MITYRTEKGAPLSIDEMDGNFRDIESRLKILEAHLESGEGIGKILVQGAAMNIVGTFGTDFGVFPLPKASLKPRGLWVAQTPYQELDLVVQNHGVYCCSQDHLSTLWEQDVHAWQEILTFPTPTPLILYERATLPVQEERGKQALLIDEHGITLIFFDGKKWQRLMKGEDL